MEHRQIYRHELKYLVSVTQLAMLQQRLGGIMQCDAHSGKTGTYHVRSLYYDDYANSCYYDNENGADHRAKYRIRIYGASTDRISLECKRKDGGMTLKTACLISREQADRLVAGKPVQDADQPLLREFCAVMRTRLLRPVVIVEYERRPYICADGNTRVTLDTSISSSQSFSSFFSKNISKRPVMLPGMQLLEVKYDAFLPDTVYQAAQVDNLRQTAFSKYYYARKFTI